MERRKNKRIKKQIKVKVNSRPGNVMDISRGGLRLSAALTKTSRDIDIALKTENKIHNLKGSIQWMSHKRDPYNNMSELGVVVPNPPQDYRQYLDTLNWDVRDNFEYGWVLIILSIMLLIGVVVGIITLFDLYHI